jgi:septal ring factor EnvC (AmiA/AmiB activator)
MLLVAQTKKSDNLKNSKKAMEAEISNTQKLLEQTRKNKNTQLQQISMLRQQIVNRESLITALNNELFSLEEELALNVKLLQELDKKLEYMKSDYAHVVYLVYKNRKMTDKFTFLLSSENFTQMFRRLRYYTIFANDVKRQVAVIEATQEEIVQKNTQITQFKNEKSLLLSGKEQEVRRLEQDRTEKKKQADDLQKKERTLAADLKAKQQKRKELDAAIKKAIQAEIAAANAKKQKAAAAAKAKSGSSATTASTTTASNNTILSLTPEEQTLSNSFANNKGRLPWPVAKGAKIADFGSYPHPDIPSVMIENKGIDILTEANVPVWCIFQGEVSGVMDIMGTKVLMVRHGEYVSVYQNMASVNVKKGDRVSTKQTLGTVAKVSGGSTYELHFEVWKNSSNLNPNQWLLTR